MSKKKVALAFSSGLDTSYCVKYLSEDLGLEVHTVTVNAGGFSPDEEKSLADRAKLLGAASHKTINIENEYYAKGLRYLIFGNVLRNGTYPLSVSAERVFQAIAIAEYARQIQTDFIAHGSTGAGNDQIRFDMVFNILTPDLEILTPVREQKLTREQEIEYLKKHGVNMDWKQAEYSINQGLWGTSVGGKETLRSDLPLPEEAYPTKVSKSEPENLTLHFEKGECVGINETRFQNPVEAIKALNAMAAPFGIGRDIHVGDTIIGIKGRVGFEAAAPILIIKAHQALEKHVLTKWQIYWKDQLSNWYGMLMHEGQYLEPVMRDIEAFLEHSQQSVTGKVFLRLHTYRFEILGIESPFDLMDAQFASYGEVNRAWTAEDAKGFAKLLANQTRIYHAVHQNQEENS